MHLPIVEANPAVPAAAVLISRRAVRRREREVALATEAEASRIEVGRSLP